jgi:hypothetical protein
MIKDIAVGDAVVFTSATAQEHKALVTAIWGDINSPTEPAINIVLVSDDNTRNDQYGRQIERHSSVVHQKMQAAHGMFWRRLTE